MVPYAEVCQCAMLTVCQTVTVVQCAMLTLCHGATVAKCAMVPLWQAVPKCTGVPSLEIDVYRPNSVRARSCYPDIYTVYIAGKLK